MKQFEDIKNQIIPVLGPEHENFISKIGFDV